MEGGEFDREPLAEEAGRQDLPPRIREICIASDQRSPNGNDQEP